MTDRDRQEFNVICKPDRGGEVLGAGEDAKYVVVREYRVRDASGEVVYLTLNQAVALATELQDGPDPRATFIVREA